MNPYRYDDPSLDPNKVAGDNIAARRRTLGWSRAVLATKLGRDEYWLRRIEEGQTIPAHLLPTIGHALELNDPFMIYRPGVFK